HAGTVEDRSHQHEHGDRQQRVLGQPGIEVLRHRQQAEPGDVLVGQHDGQRAGHAERHAYRHADHHQDRENREQQGGDHRAGLRHRRRSVPAVRSTIAAARMGSQIEYHQVGTPIAGEVSSYMYSSITRRTERTVSRLKNSSTTLLASSTSARRRAGVPPSATASMRIWWLRTKAALPPAMVSTMSRKIEISSVQANDWSVK